MASFGVALSAGAPLAFASVVMAGPHDALIARYAAANGVPEALVRRIIQIESRGNPGVVHAGNYGLMQIRLGTARGMGYRGDARGLLDAETNLTYAVKYLAGAWRAAGCRTDRAIHYYQRGYYGVRQAQCGVTADVLQPRAVRTETIGAGGEVITPTRPVGRFEPVRMTAEPAPPGVAAQLAAIPLPPARRDLDVAPERGGKPVAHSPRGHAKAAKAEQPVGVAALMKKSAAPAGATGAAATGLPPPGPQPPL